MKKNIFCLCFTLFLLVPSVFAEDEEINFDKILSTTTMPSDQEIRETIHKFNFDPSQEEYLFKETKKKLIEMYSTKKMPQKEAEN